MTDRGRLAVTLALVVAAVAAPLSGAGLAAPDDGPNFTENVYTVSEGEVAEINVTIPGGANDTTTLTIGSEDANFRAVATVTDTDGDGTVTVTLDTSEAMNGDASSYVGVSDGDDLENATEEIAGGEAGLDPANYDLRLGPDDGSSPVATLVVQDDGSGSGGDSGETGDQPGFTENVYSVRQGETARIDVTVPDGANDTAALTIGSAEVNFRAVATVTDADGDGTITVTLDTGKAMNGDASSYIGVSDGDELANVTEEIAGGEAGLDPANYELSVGSADEPADVATLSINDADSGADGDDGSSDGQSGTTLVYEGEELTLRAADGQTIRGETTLDPGTTLTVRIQSTNSGSPFLRQTETEVTEFGTFNATVDLHDAEPNSSLTVTVRKDSERLATAEGRIVECDREGCEYDPTPVHGSSTDAPTPADTDSIALPEVVDVRSGDTAEIPITFGDDETLRVTVKPSSSDGQEISANVTDADGDGRATVLVRTGELAANESRVLVREGNETRPADVTAAPPANASLEPYDYPVTLYNWTENDGRVPADIGTLLVFEGTPTTTPSGAGDGAIEVQGAGFGSVPVEGLAALAAGGLLAVGGIGLLLSRQS